MLSEREHKERLGGHGGTLDRLRHRVRVTKSDHLTALKRLRKSHELFTESLKSVIAEVPVEVWVEDNAFVHWCLNEGDIETADAARDAIAGRYRS